MSSADDEPRLWIPILCYHRVVPTLPSTDPFHVCVSTGVFESHLKWLAGRRFRPLPLSELQAFFDAPDSGRLQKLRRAVAITFDDGYEDNYLYAWPLLQRYGFTATIFLVSDAIGGDNAFDASFTTLRTPMLSVEQIRQMHLHGIEFGSHTRSHPSTLVDLTDDQLTNELGCSRSAIESILNAPVDQFSYPHSKLDTRVETAVERAGYRLACAGAGTRFSRFCLSRVDPPSGPGARVEAAIRLRRLKWAIRQRSKMR